MFAVVRDLIRYNKEFAIGALLVGIIVGFSLLSYFSPVDPTLVYMVPPERPPSTDYWFGTNSRGQELFWQDTFAIRHTLVLAPSWAFLPPSFPFPRGWA